MKHDIKYLKRFIMPNRCLDKTLQREEKADQENQTRGLQSLLGVVLFTFRYQG